MSFSDSIPPPTGPGRSLAPSAADLEKAPELLSELLREPRSFGRILKLNFAHAAESFAPVLHARLGTINAAVAQVIHSHMSAPQKYDTSSTSLDGAMQEADSELLDIAHSPDRKLDQEAKRDMFLVVWGLANLGRKDSDTQTSLEERRKPQLAQRPWWTLLEVLKFLQIHVDDPKSVKRSIWKPSTFLSLADIRHNRRTADADGER
ncbi:hypothetical protein RQP46_005921 [Phenoliferia psychrophenolica]